MTEAVIKPIYGKGRFPKQMAKRLCRGCHKPVPSNRQSWCSDECYQKWEPRNVKAAVRSRDKGVCQRCGVDTRAAVREWYKREPDRYEDFPSHRNWCRERPTVEYDHIIPFCEGGLTVLENIRTLCVPCHRIVTAEFHKRRAKARKQGGQLEG